MKIPFFLWGCSNFPSNFTVKQMSLMNFSLPLQKIFFLPFYFFTLKELLPFLFSFWELYIFLGVFLFLSFFSMKRIFFSFPHIYFSHYRFTERFFFPYARLTQFLFAEWNWESEHKRMFKLNTFGVIISLFIFIKHSSTYEFLFYFIFYLHKIGNPK